MSLPARAQFQLDRGAQEPFDRPDPARVATSPSDPAVAIARGLFADLGDRIGFRSLLENMDAPARAALFETTVTALRQVPPTKAGADQAVTLFWAGLRQHPGIQAFLDTFTGPYAQHYLGGISKALSDIVQQGHQRAP
jgi:hypothetical protein